MFTFPEINVGEPICYELLSIFPLMAEEQPKVNYLLSDEALATGSVTVEEISERGTVPELIVKNQSDTLVLFLEGEELKGAKQNRILNTSVLVAANSCLKIPVSCVEQGRWGYNSPTFSSGDKHCSMKMRHILKKSVLKTVKEGRGHVSDQDGIWNEVRRQAVSLGVNSGTGAMADTYEAHKSRLDEYRDRLKYVEGATGMAMAINNQFISVELFDKPSTCERVWNRLLTGIIMDALEAVPSEKQVKNTDASSLLKTIRGSTWEEIRAVGAGKEYRAACGGDNHASALICNDCMVHGSLIVAG